MAEMKIKIVTEIGQSQSALNKETRSVKTLGDALIHTKKNTKDFTEAQKAFALALQRDLQKAFDQASGGLKGYEAELKVLEKYETNLRLGVGKTSDTYKTYKSLISQAKVEIGKIRDANSKAEKAQKAHNTALEDFGLHLQDIQRQIANIQALNKQNANVGFMMLTGDELGVAKYSLDMYEQSLKEVIAETGVNSKATQEAYEKYAQQKLIVDELSQSQERYANVQQATSEETEDSTKAITDMGKASDRTGIKILSVAKNILRFQLLMAPITALVRGVKNTVSDSMKVAAEAEQVFNKLATVFDGFGDSAKKMATELASSIGVANSTAASALSTVGDLLQAQGMGTSQSLSTASEWVRQFQDIIAFKDINMSLEEFAQNFMSGAAGNLRNFRTFGSIVKESAVNAELAKKGLDKLTGSQLELAKMTTRAELALEQQANAMGATQREWETALSVNRRLSEAWKAYKENLGDTINSVLVPMKRWWTEILDSINEANEKQKEFNKEAKEVDTQKSIHQSASNLAPFLKDVYSAEYAGLLNRNDVYQRGGKWYYEKLGGAEEELAGFGKALDLMVNIMTYYGASVDDLQKYATELELSETALKALTELEERRKLQVEADARAAKNLSALSSSYDSYTSFIEAISGITGVGTLNTVNFTEEALQRASRGDMSSQTVSNMISNGGLSAIEQAMAQIAAADIKAWGDVISGELGDLDEGELRQKVAESYRSLFENAWNEFGKDGSFSDEEKARLEGIKQAYQDANDAAEAYQKRLEAEAGITSHITSAQDVIAESDMRSRYSALGANDSQISIYIKYEKALAELNEQFELLGKETVEINGQLYDQVDATSLLYEARNKELIAIKKEEEEVLKLSDIIAKGIFGANSDKGYAQSFAGAVANSTGGQLVQAGMEGGIIGILTEILVQTETFTSILESIDPIITTFSEFIKPILPAVQLIFTVLNELVFSILKPFFPIIKGIAMVVATLAYPIKIVTNVIKNIYTAVHNILERITHPLSGGDRWSYVSLTDGVDEITNIIRDIKNMTFDIKENTDPSNSEILKAYNNMFQKGLITASEYQGLLADMNGLNYDRMRTYEGGAWQNGRGGVTNVYYGDMKFEINGTNLSAEQIAEAVTRKQMEQNKTLQYYA